MNDTYTKVYFDLTIAGSNELHNWIELYDSILNDELIQTLKQLHVTAWKEQESILVHLHYMYFYRYTLPVLEAVCGFEQLKNKPELIKFQLLSCLLGRFLDDLIDSDSGFWNHEQALFWYSHFLLRSERALKNIFINKNLEPDWIESIYKSLNNKQNLYDSNKNTNIIVKSNIYALPLNHYPERVPYYFLLLENLCDNEESIEWVRMYISSLFFLSDIDDSINDILRNVPTQPAYDILLGSLDNEGRFKIRLTKEKKIYPKLYSRAKSMLLDCRDKGYSLGYKLGPAVINATLEENGLIE